MEAAPDDASSASDGSEAESASEYVPSSGYDDDEDEFARCESASENAGESADASDAAEGAGGPDEAGAAEAGAAAVAACPADGDVADSDSTSSEYDSDDEAVVKCSLCGDPIAALSTAPKTLTCDGGCERTLPRGVQCFSCDSDGCDFDICQKCAGHRHGACCPECEGCLLRRTRAAEELVCDAGCSKRLPASRKRYACLACDKDICIECAAETNAARTIDLKPCCRCRHAYVRAARPAARGSAQTQRRHAANSGAWRCVHIAHWKRDQIGPFSAGHL